MATKDKTKILQIRIDDDMLSAFQEITERFSINRSALIHSWIKKYIDAHKSNNNTNQWL